MVTKIEKSDNGSIPLPRWLTQDVLLYIIDCYVGVDASKGVPRRLFKWEENGQMYQGNAEAFLDHLNNRFGFGFARSAASSIHEALRFLGEPAKQMRKHDRDPRRPDGPQAGKFQQPEPDKWALYNKKMN